MDLKREKIREIYDEVSAEYNATPLATIHGWIEKLSSSSVVDMQTISRHLPEHGVLVDIGTGKGIGPRFAKKLGVRVISVDSRDAGGTSAIDNVRLAGVEAYLCDILRDPLPVGDATADCVLFADVIEHLIHSPKAALKEIYRVLKPGGVCVATTPNAMRLTVRLRVLLGYTNWANIHEFFDKSFHHGHHHEYTIDEFKFVFQSVGFEMLEFTLRETSLRNVIVTTMADIATQHRPSRMNEKEALAVSAAKRILLAWTFLFPRLRSGMILVAKKPLREERQNSLVA